MNYKNPLKKGSEESCEKTCKTCPHETRPRENGEWGKKFLHNKLYRRHYKTRFLINSIHRRAGGQFHRLGDFSICS